MNHQHKKQGPWEKSIKVVVFTLVVSDPRTFEEAEKSVHWKNAMAEEIQCIQKMKHGSCVEYHQRRKLLVRSGFIRPNINQMENWRNRKQGLL